jgi:hypothetical protein
VWFSDVRANVTKRFLLCATIKFYPYLSLSRCFVFPQNIQKTSLFKLSLSRFTKASNEGGRSRPHFLLLCILSSSSHFAASFVSNNFIVIIEEKDAQNFHRKTETVFSVIDIRFDDDDDDDD